MFSPTSLPSPPESWQFFSVTQWLDETFGLALPFELRIHAYAICLMLGMLAAGIIAHVRLTRRGAEPGVVLDISIWAIVLGIVGARAWHVLSHPDDYFGAGANPLEVLYVWNGGIAIFGSLTGGAVGAFIGCRIAGIRFWTFADALAPGLLVGQAIGRVGNYFNQELFGWPTALPWGLEIDPSNPAFPSGLADDTLFHPTFLYEAVWNVAGAVVLVVLAKRLGLEWGKVFGAYLIWYGAGRAVLETIRVDPSELILGIRTNVWGAFVAILLGLVIIAVQTKRHTGLEPSPYRAGHPGYRKPDPRGTVASGDRWSDSDDENVSETADQPAATSGAGTTR
jgi:prolipoprotein diacylglyceryl transferase